MANLDRVLTELREKNEELIKQVVLKGEELAYLKEGHAPPISAEIEAKIRNEIWDETPSEGLIEDGLKFEIGLLEEEEERLKSEIKELALSSLELLQIKELEQVNERSESEASYLHKRADIMDHAVENVEGA